MSQQTHALPDSAILCGIEYRIHVSPEGLIVFVERAANRICTPCRIAFHKSLDLWRLSSVDGRSAGVHVSHVLAAYQLLCDCFGGDFSEAGGAV